METTTTAPAMAEPQQQEISDFGRVIGVLTSPAKTFADIVRKPKWIMPVVLLAVAGVASSYVMNQRMDWRPFIQRQIENSPWANRIPPEQMPQIIADGTKNAPRNAYIFGTIGNSLVALWFALVYWGSFNILASAGAKFKTALSIATHACLPILVISPIEMLVMYLKSYGDIDPEHLLATNVASFLPENAPKWAASLGSSLDVVWIWMFFLLAMGFRAVNPKKISLSKALLVVFGVWLVGVFIKVSLVAATG